MPALRRSNRAKKTAVVLPVGSSYPDGPPCSPVEQHVAKLDQESFPSAAFARIDGILTHALFATKRNSSRYLALRPSCAFSEEVPNINLQKLVEIGQLFEFVAKERTSSTEFALEFTKEVKKNHPELIASSVEERVFKHLSARYLIFLHDPASCVKLQKVQFHVGGAGAISCGLQAKTPIEAGSVLLSLCSSMSLDLVKDRACVSIVEAVKEYHLPKGPRLILGPFRFANHDCNPNCQIMPVPKSQAFTLCTLRPISEGESITVKYTSDGSYFGGGSCGCATCNPSRPPVVERRQLDPAMWIPKDGKKRSRGGKRAKRRRPCNKGDNESPTAV